MVECAERCWGIRVNSYLTGDKSMCTYDHGPKSKGIMMTDDSMMTVWVRKGLTAKTKLSFNLLLKRVS